MSPVEEKGAERGNRLAARGRRKATEVLGSGSRWLCQAPACREPREVRRSFSRVGGSAERSSRVREPTGRFKDRGPAGVSPGLFARAPRALGLQWERDVPWRSSGLPAPTSVDEVHGLGDAAPLAGGQSEAWQPDSPRSLEAAEFLTSYLTHLRLCRASLPSPEASSCGTGPGVSRFLSLWLCALVRRSCLGPRSFPGRVPGCSEPTLSHSQYPRRVRQDGTIPGQ